MPEPEEDQQMSRKVVVEQVSTGSTRNSTPTIIAIVVIAIILVAWILTNLN